MIEFARQDLSGVNRSATPWVIVTAHYPLYETYDNTCPVNIAHEQSKADGGARGRMHPRQKNAVLPTPSKAQALLDYEPLLAEFGVDVFFAGHDHNYETTWPVYNNQVQQLNYTNPTAPIHILSGSAGPPEWDNFNGDVHAWTREPRLQMNGYGRVTVENANTLRFEQVCHHTVVVACFRRDSAMKQKCYLLR